MSRERLDAVDESVLSQKVEAYLKETLAEVTELPVTQIDSDLRFEEFGVDSIVVTDFNLRLEKGLGPLPKTLLFEFPNFRELTRHLVAAFKPQITRFLGQRCFAGIGSLEQLRCSIWMESAEAVTPNKTAPRGITDGRRDCHYRAGRPVSQGQ